MNMRFEMSDGGCKLLGRDGIDPPEDREALMTELGRVAAEGSASHGSAALALAMSQARQPTAPPRVV